jgi:hypothetical protein
MVGESGLPAAYSLIEYMTGFMEDKDQKNHFIFGRILSTDVRAVEIVYADEQILKSYDLTQEITALSERDESGKISCPNGSSDFPVVTPSSTSGLSVAKTPEVKPTNEPILIDRCDSKFKFRRNVCFCPQ